MKAYIDGAGGSIGMALIAQLIKNGCDVTVFGRPDSSRFARSRRVFQGESAVRFLELDLKEYKDALQDFVWLDTNKATKTDDITVFFHLGWGKTFGAGRDDVAAQQKNVEYTLDAVRLAKALGCNTFIGAGSQAEYGPKEEALLPDTIPTPQTAYGSCKLEAGVQSRALCQELGMRHIWVRILSVYGPYDTEGTMVMSSVIRMLRNEKVSYTKAEQIWDYIYSEDAANALYLAALKGKNGAIYPLGSGKAKPLFEYIYEIRDCINPDLVVGIGEVPYSQGNGQRPVMYLKADISALQADTGFEPKVDFLEGIKRTISWYRKEN